MNAIVSKALRPALNVLVPVFVDALSKHGPAAVESMFQSALRSPERRAWRTYASAALTGLTASPHTDPTTDLPALADQAAIADEMVKREAERTEQQAEQAS